MSRKSVRKHHTNPTADTPTQQLVADEKGATISSASRKAAVIATAPKQQDPHTSSTQRGLGVRTETHSQTPLPSDPMAIGSSNPNATKEMGAAEQVPSRDGPTSYNRGRHSLPCRRYFTVGCDVQNCRWRHPPRETLAPCLNYMDGRCHNPKCPRPHVAKPDTVGTEVPHERLHAEGPRETGPHVNPPSVTPVTSPSPAAVPPAKPATPPKESVSATASKRVKDVCRDFKKGRCKKGDKCPRIHVSDVVEEHPSSKSETPSSQPGKSVAGDSIAAPERSINTSTKANPATRRKSKAAGNALGSGDPTPTATSVPQPESPAPDVTHNPPPKGQELCRKFLHGKCHKPRCPYKHDPTAAEATKPSKSKRDAEVQSCDSGAAAPPESTAMLPDQTEHALPDTEKEVCKSFILHGACPHGSSCPRVHRALNELNKYIPPTDETCPLFMTGQCRMGANCRYRHPPTETPSPQQIDTSRRTVQGSNIGTNGASSLPETTPLANHNGRLPATSARGAEKGKTRDESQNLPPTSSAKGKQPQRPGKLPKLAVSRPPPAEPASPSSTAPATPSSVTDEAPIFGLRQPAHHPRSRNEHSAPTLTADTSMSSMTSEPIRTPQYPLPPQTSHEPSQLIKDMERILRQMPRRAPSQPFDQYQQSFNAKSGESAFVVQPKAPIPLLPPGLGLERIFAPVPPQPTPIGPETISINVLDAVHVTFEAGLQVKNIKTGFESPIVIIKNVPVKTKAENISRLLSRYGEVQYVHIPDATEQQTMTVKATMSTNDEAVRAVSALDDTVAFGKTISVIHASDKSTTLGKGTVRDVTVRIEFPAPQKDGYASYETSEAADKAIAKAKIMLLGDCEIHAEKFVGVPNLGPHTVKFQGLPPDAKLDILNEFGPNKQVMLGRPNYASVQSIAKKLLWNLERHGEIEKLTFLGPTYIRQHVLAWAQFKSPAGADKACAALHKRQQKYIGEGRLFLKHDRSIVYTLPSDVWDAIRYDVVTLNDRFRTSEDRSWVHWRPPSSRNRTAQVKLCADKQPALTKMKIAFDAILRGERVAENGHWVWDPFFSRKAGEKYLDIVQSDYRDVLINCDTRKRYISVFGPPRARELVRNRLIRKVEDLRSQNFHTFPLDGGLIGLFMNADLLKLQEELGHENVILDPANQVLKIRGNEDALQVTRLILRHAKERRVLQRKSHGSVCPICLDDVSLPVTLSCGHSWCKRCITDYLMASVDNRVFPLKCLGNEGRCALPIPVVIAKELLSSEQFAAVTRASFLSYIHSRATEFFYCPTPDCPQVYRTAASDTILHCPSCLVRICGNCHIESHEGTKCADREREDRRLFEKWSSTRDVKNCPGCKTPIERIAGCNHITCLHCKTHICWECLATFEQSGEVYDHMRSTHGGIGVEEFWF